MKANLNPKRFDVQLAEGLAYVRQKSQTQTGAVEQANACDAQLSEQAADQAPAKTDVAQFKGRDEDDIAAMLDQLNQYRSTSDKLMKAMDESNRKIKEAAKQFEKFKPKMTAVPSALGLKVNAATGKMGASSIHVRSIKREHNADIPEGHVVAQVPGPGGRVDQKAGVTLIISKGPPPEHEKYSNIKKRENVAFLRFKSKLTATDPKDGSVNMDLLGDSGGDGVPVL